MVQQNLGKVDRVLRFLLAFWWLGPWAPVYSAAWAQWLVLIVGWIALIESFVGWCGLHSALNINNKSQ